MPRTCSICAHPERTAIEQAIVAGTSLRHIASQFNAGYKSVERHADAGHIKASVAAEQVAKDAQRTIDVEKQLLTINAAMFKILKDSMTDKKQYGMAVAANNAIMKQLDFAHRISKDEEVERRLLALEELSKPYE